ncbi:MAG TPA: Tad domain-containing protein, partial [Candidatus Deferrimicrobiaceae bacterium]|nr:Tad domain-containing protein [Candidatus Deferrimicrobiaceae bacterium]
MKRVRNWASGQSLVLFVIFLTVLLGVSALGIDYATWLLTDRKLQNVTDSAVTAGASAFGNRIAKGSCATSPGDASCDQARLQAWTSINDALELGMDTTQLANISTSDRYALTSFSGTNFKGYTIWVTTPPPNDPAYTGLGGRLTLNFGIVWARVDVTAPSFFSNVFGIGPSQRHGWATAGTLPTDFALQIFCRTSVDPSCGGSGQAALVIDGQGGIRLIRGDIGSNESLKVTAQGGNGVILESGYMFLVNGVCGSSSWNCPQIPAVAGGIADDNPNAIPNTANNSNAFYIPPQPVPHYASPTTGTVTRWDCNGASSSQLCVPYQDQADLTPNAPGDWACGPDTPEFCGAPDLTGPSGTVSCVGTVAGNPGNHYYPTGFAKGGSGGASITNPDPLHPQSPNSNNYLNIDEVFNTGNADTTNP